MLLSVVAFGGGGEQPETVNVLGGHIPGMRAAIKQTSYCLQAASEPTLSASQCCSHCTAFKMAAAAACSTQQSAVTCWQQPESDASKCLLASGLQLELGQNRRH
jgi:hypothetical protein